jgi:hypothetical protein
MTWISDLRTLAQLAEVGEALPLVIFGAVLTAIGGLAHELWCAFRDCKDKR